MFERTSASPAMIRALVESLAVTDVRSRLAEIAVPVLVVHRRSDYVPFSEAGLLTRGIKGARLAELDGSDHLPWVGDVGGVLSPIAEFVGEVAGRPAPSDCAAPPRCRPFSGCPQGQAGALAGDAGHHKDPMIARGIADAFRDADLVASAVVDGWDGDLDGALADYGRQRDQCAILLSDANLSVARLDLPTEQLGTAWFHMAGLEQALDDPAAIT